MPVVLITDIPTLDIESYKKLHDIVLAPGRPQGMISHCCHAKGSGVSIIDIWETRRDFQAFMQQKLEPAMEELGVDGEPEILMLTDLINVNAYAYEE